MSEPNTNCDIKTSKLLPGRNLLQIHTNAIKVLPKGGLKDFAPSNSWLEKKQIESILEENKSILEEERVEKWGALAGACWKQSIKLAEVTRRSGRHFNTMGFEKNGNLYLYPEEALYLLETNSLELLFGGVPISIQQAYALLLGSESGCSVIEYRTYSHLVRQGYRVLRPSKQIQTTQYESLIHLDQHSQKKHLHPGSALPGNQPVLDSMSCTGSNLRSTEVNGSSMIDSKCTPLNLNHEDTSASVSNHVQFPENQFQDNEKTAKQTVDPESQAYGIAKSLVSLGTGLLKDSTVSSDSEKKASSDMNDILLKQIIEVLGSHFNNDVSKNTLEAVALSATETILSHGATGSVNKIGIPLCASSGREENVLVHLEDDESKRSQNDIHLSDDSTSYDVEKCTTVDIKDDEIGNSLCGSSGTEDHVRVILEDNESKKSQNDTHLSDDSTSFDGEESTTVEVKDDSDEVEDVTSIQVETTPIMEEISVDETSSLKDSDFPGSLKRQQTETPDIKDNEQIIFKKAKLVDVSDSEIEILDLAPEKKVEVIDLSDDDSNFHSDLTPSKLLPQIRKKDVIDVDIASQSDSESSSSDSSDSSTHSSSDSSIVCIETEKEEISRKESSYQKIFDLKRKNILNSFPCMYNLQQITLSAPDPDLLPEHVQPNFSTYVINRWKLLHENKHTFHEMQESHERTIHPHGMNMNLWLPQTPPQFLLGAIPSHPWTLMQTLAQLLLPFTNQAPHFRPRWPQDVSTWTHRTPPWPRPSWPRPSWPRPSWPRTPYIKPYQRRHQRSQYFRHNNPRFSMRAHTRSSFPPRSHFQDVPRHQSENFGLNSTSNCSRQHLSRTNYNRDVLNNVEPLPHTSNRDASNNVKPVPPSKSEDTTSFALGDKPCIFKKKSQISKKENKKRPFKGSPRYFNPTKKYSHILKEEAKFTLNEVIKPEELPETTETSSSSSAGSSTSEEDESHENEPGSDFEGSAKNSSKPLLQPNLCSDFASVCRFLQVIQQADLSTLNSVHLPDVLKLNFDIFLPSTSFKKGSPPNPSYHLCVVDVNDPVPSPLEISFLLRKLNDGVPILFAIVYPGSITFLQFLDVSLPLLPVNL